MLKELINLHYHHKKNCVFYKNYCITHFHDDINKLDDLPYLPVRLFKEYQLKSINDDDVYKTMLSSGTTGKQSKIYLDKKNANLQRKELINTFSSFFGKHRRPMVVIDKQSTVKNRDNFSARTAAINGFSIFSRDTFFLINEDNSLNYEGFEQFLLKYDYKNIFFFGFTFLLYSNFLKLLEVENKKYCLKDSIILHGGGWKKLVDISVSNEDLKKISTERLGVTNCRNYYGMIEQTGTLFMECEYGNLHPTDRCDFLIRDMNTFEPCEESEQGLIQVLSDIQTSYPGYSLLTEDVGFFKPYKECKCGSKKNILKITSRLKMAEVRGCSDAN